MAIYDLGTASMAANGEVTGVGTTWKAPLTLIRVGATIVFKTEPVQIYTISEIISDTNITVYNPNSETVPAGTGYAILAHDGITVQGLAQDVAETLRYYQSKETEVSNAVDAFNNFDSADFESKVAQVNTQHGDVVSIGAQISSDAAQVTADKNAAAASATSASADKDAAAASAQEAADYAASLNTQNLLRKDLALSDLTDKPLARNNLDVYSKSETYEKSEVDSKLNKIVMYATDLGFGGTRQQNEDALYNIYLLLKNATSPITIKFPAGVFEIGSQQQSGAMGAGYAFRPSYLEREWEDESAAGWFSISNTDQAHTIDMTGCTLKLASGMKVGSFDPVTGEPYEQGSMETPLFDYNSNSGVMIKVRRAPNITIIGGATDGNLSGAVFGGKFGNTGYQTLCYNAWFNESLGVKVLGHKFINSAVDGVYFQHTTEFTRLNIVKRSLFQDCEILNCGRNCFALTGGRSVDIDGCTISGSGRMASGIGSNYSGPEACMDIEAESGFPEDINVSNTSLINAGKHSIYTVSTPNRVSDINFKNCTISSFHSEGAIANVGPTKSVSFSKCYIIGSIIDSGKQMLSDAYSFNDCEMLNNYGGTYADSYSLTFKVRSFIGNRITFGIPASNVTTPTISIDDQDGVNFGVVSGRFKSNYLEVYGDASKVTFENGLGGLNNFKSIELFVNSAGISNGTLKLLVDTSSVSLNGLTTNSTSFNFATEMIKDDSQNIWFANAKARVQSLVSASSTNIIDIGSKSQAFSTIYMQKGVVFQDLVNPSNYYRLRVINGAIELIQDV